MNNNSGLIYNLISIHEMMYVVAEIIEIFKHFYSMLRSFVTCEVCCGTGCGTGAGWFLRSWG